MSLSLMKNGDFHVTRSAGHGLCYICNCKKQPGDLGIFRGGSIDYEGQLDICQRCIEHAGNQIGMMTIEEAERRRETQMQLVEDLAEAEELAAEMEKALAALGYVGELKANRRERTKVKQ